MNTENILGKKIKELRKQMGFTQHQLAELANVDDKHLSKIENGIHLPTYITLKKLSSVLKFNLQDIDNLSEDDYTINSPIYQKILKVINSANSEKELENYYEVLKFVQRLMNSN